MTPTRQTTEATSRLSWWWRGLCWICCLLTLLSPAPSALLAPAQTQTVFPDPVESEERAPAEEEDDGKEPAEKSKEATREQSTRQSRSRRGLDAIANYAWLAHLPHHHACTAGYVLPVCTPFERGALLPLRC